MFTENIQLPSPSQLLDANRRHPGVKMTKFPETVLAVFK